MSERKEDWIRIRTPDNEDQIASPNYILKLLEIDRLNILNRLNVLENKVLKLDSPQRKQKIIDALYKKGKHNKIWLSNRVDYRWYDLEDLIDDGIILETKAGTQYMYELPE